MNTRRVQVIYRFNKIEVDLNQFEIRESGAPLLVEPKVFDLIAYLLEHRTRLVSREELFEQVWKGREVSDTSLSNHIKSARKILGDNGNLQQVIKTVRSRGYQFIAEVIYTPLSELNESIQPKKRLIESPTAPQTIRKSAHHFGFIVLLFFFILLIAAGSTWSILTSEQPSPNRPYLLVVPFSISSNNPAIWQPFADQITRELIQSLRKISGVQIVPPPSSFTFKSNKIRTHIQEQLPEVNYVIDGVISEGVDGNIRITVELENLYDGTLLWDGDFDIQIDNINRFKIQHQIAASVSESLQVIILEEEKQGLAQVPTTSLPAYNLYVQGQHQLSLMTHNSVLSSITYFTQAIELEPKFEAASIAKASAYRIIMTLFDIPKNILPKVISSAVEVLETNPESAQVMSLLGLAYVHAWQWEDAWKMLSNARNNDPNIALTELGFTLYYSAMGDVEGVIQSLAKADKLDPLNEEIADWGMWALMMVNEIDAAIVWGEEKIQLHPTLPYPLLSLAVAEYIKGNIEKSIMLASKGVELSQREPFPLILLAQSYAAAGNSAQAYSLLAEAQGKKQYICPYESAIIHAILNEPNKVFPLLNQAVEYQSNCLMFTRNDPRLNTIKNDSRYAELLKTLALDDDSVAKYSR
jgi:DNA-binding winged helix-turn-helix (wHTH) protein/TolB-like protein/Tfp pilus assembly protein PilF